MWGLNDRDKKSAVKACLKERRLESGCGAKSSNVFALFRRLAARKRTPEFSNVM